MSAIVSQGTAVVQPVFCCRLTCPYPLKEVSFVYCETVRSERVQSAAYCRQPAQAIYRNVLVILVRYQSQVSKNSTYSMSSTLPLFVILTQLQHIGSMYMPICKIYPNFKFVPFLVWAVLRVAVRKQPQNRVNSFFYREYRGGETGSTRRHLGHLPAGPT